MRTVITVILTFLVNQVQTQTLDDYIIVALENNPGLKARQTEVEVVKQKVYQVGSLPDPQLNASFFMNAMMLPMGNQLGSISVMQMFPWFGTLDAMENEVHREADIMEQMVATTRNELIYKVRTAWYPLLEVEKKILILKENLVILETDKELATSRFQYARGPMVDVIRADIMIDELRTEIILLEQKRKPLQFAFNRLLNLAEDTPIILREELPEPDLRIAAGTDEGVENNPALIIFDKQIAMTEAAAAVADNMRKPMLGAGLQYMPLVRRNGGDVNIPPNTGRDMVMPMFTMSIPIWKKKYDAAVQERQLMKTVYTDMKEDMYNELSTMVEMTRYELDVMQQMIELLNSQVIKTQQAIDLLMAAYQNGSADFEEVLRLQQQIFKYRMEKVSAQTEYQLMSVKLDYLTGK